MFVINFIQDFLDNLNLPDVLIIGILVFIGLYFGKTMKFIKLPSIIAFMIIGIVVGPSLLNILNESFQEKLSFITEIALGFVAVTIGVELSMKTLKLQGKSIILIIFSESFMAFLLVAVSVFLFVIISPIKNNLAIPFALLFGALAPASAPAVLLPL